MRQLNNGQNVEKPARSFTISRIAPRREGFAGQHLVVLPEPLRAQARRQALLRGLFVTDAGYFPQAAGHLVERPAGASTALVLLCLRGTGWVRIGNRTRAVAAGDLVWLEAGEAHAYGADEANPWTISWVHFAGEESAGWREFLAASAGTEDVVWPLPPDHVDEVALDRVHAALERGLALRHQVAAAAALRTAFGRMGDILVERHGHRSARERVAASVEALGQDWRRTHRLGELAAGAGMSVTHYCGHFRELTGFAPVDYLIRLRVKQACQLLDTTALTVTAVAAAAGYEDPYYFTRCFRRVMGCSPRAYRRIPKG